MPDGFIPPHGGYANLLSYRKAEIVYDATVYFCDRFLDRRDRTRDQMIQAARRFVVCPSGHRKKRLTASLQASQASGTSNLYGRNIFRPYSNVARASLEELLADYRDFLRTRSLQEWPRDPPHTKRLRALNRQPDATYATFRKGIEHAEPEVSANVVLGLIKLTNYLLDQQLRRLEKDFLQAGGLRERMTRARLAERDKQKKERRQS